MNDTGTLAWDEEYGARFKKLSDRDVEVWQEIVTNEIRNLHAGEVLKAVRLLGEEKRHGKHKYAPTVEDLISAIIKNRWLDRVSRDGMGPQNNACVFCRDEGWISFGAACKKSEAPDGASILSMGVQRHTEDGWPYGDFAVPCQCSRGQSALKSYPEAMREKINSLTRRAMDWIKGITAESPFDDRRFAVDEGAGA